MQTFEEVLTHFHSFLESATYLDVVPCRWGYVRLFNEGNPIRRHCLPVLFEVLPIREVSTLKVRSC